MLEDEETKEDIIDLKIDMESVSASNSTLKSESKRRPILHILKKKLSQNFKSFSESQTSPLIKSDYQEEIVEENKEVPDEDTSICNELELIIQNEDLCLNKTLVKQTYFSLLYALLDPFSRVKDAHNFQLKSFAIITTCFECRSVLWGVHKQGLQCQKCFMSIHEKCQELVQVDCSEYRNSKLNSANSTTSRQIGSSLIKTFGSNESKSKSNNTSQTSKELLKDQLDDVKQSNQYLINKLNFLFSTSESGDLQNDIKCVQQDYLSKSVKPLRTRVKIFVKNAVNLVSKDSFGLSDPYVTIQVGSSETKRTKTKKNDLNPVWNESFEFEYINTPDGIVTDNGNHGSKIIIRVWDEDEGLKAHLDKMLTKEGDDFLGQVVLDICDFNLNGEQSYELKARSEDDVITGHIVLSLSQTVLQDDLNSSSFNFFQRDKKRESRELKYSYLDQYRCLHQLVFKSLKETYLDSNSWLVDFLPLDTQTLTKLIYLADVELNTLITKFANRYAINETQKQMCHLECLSSYFVDSCLMNRLDEQLGEHLLDSKSNAKLLSYMSELLNAIDRAYTPNIHQTETETKNLNSLIEKDLIIVPKNLKINININENKAFLYKMCMLPNKLILLMMNFRQIYFVSSESSEECLTCLDELIQVINLFQTSCSFAYKHLQLRAFNSSMKEKKCADLFNLKYLKEKYPILGKINIRFFKKDRQLEVVKKSLEISLASEFYSFLFNEYSERKLASTENPEPSQIENRFGILTLVKEIDPVHSAEKVYNVPHIKELVLKLNSLICVLTNKLGVEIETVTQHYTRPFSLYLQPNEFRSICTRVLVREFLNELLNTVKNDQETISSLDLQSIKIHLSSYLVARQFLVEMGLDNCQLSELLDYSLGGSDVNSKVHKVTNLNEVFQPFLLEFIRKQEDQFLRYMHKIYDWDKIVSLANEISESISKSKKPFAANTYSLKAIQTQSKDSKKLSDLQNYYSTSVTDLFTILHELLNTVVQFDTNDSDLNFSHQMCFVSLIKTKLLTYSNMIKKEYHQVFIKRNSIKHHKHRFMNKVPLNVIIASNDDKKEHDAHSEDNIEKRKRKNEQTTITSCILMNNFQKTIELFDEIQLKLTNKSGLKQCVQDQLQSIKEILTDDLSTLIKQYSIEYEKSLSEACKYMQIKIDECKKFDQSDSSSSLSVDGTNLMNNLIDESFYNLLDDKLMICKSILFEEVFRQVLEELFKISIRCIENSIILKRDAQLNSESMVNQQENSKELLDQLNAPKFLDKIANVLNYYSNSSKCKENALLNKFQYFLIQNGIQHIVDFFSADETYLSRQYLLDSVECKRAFKTLDLYLISSNQLISDFIETQNVNQNNLDFTRSFGKVKLCVELKQNASNHSQFDMTVRFLELRDFAIASNVDCAKSEVDENNNNSTRSLETLGKTSQPYIDVYLFGPTEKRSWSKRTVKYERIDENGVIYFDAKPTEFKISINKNDLENVHANKRFLINHELEFVLNDSAGSKKCPRTLGVSVFNLNEAVQSAYTLRKLEEKEMLKSEIRQVESMAQSSLLHGSMEIWLSFRDRLKIDDDGIKILKVLDRHVQDTRALEFIQLKLLSRFDSN